MVFHDLESVNLYVSRIRQAYLNGLINEYEYKTKVIYLYTHFHKLTRLNKSLVRSPSLISFIEKTSVQHKQ